MMGKKSGVATQIQQEQPKAIITHCHGHSLSLAVKDLTSSCEVLSNTMGTVGEICVWILGYQFHAPLHKSYSSVINFCQKII